MSVMHLGMQSIKTIAAITNGMKCIFIATYLLAIGMVLSANRYEKNMS